MLFCLESKSESGGFEVSNTSYSLGILIPQIMNICLTFFVAKGAVKRVRSAKPKKAGKSKGIKRAPKSAPVADAGAAKSPVRAGVKRTKKSKKGGAKRSGAKTSKGKKGKARAKK